MIDLVRDRCSHGDLLPEPVRTLAGLPESVQHHSHHSLRPAAAIYNVSLNSLTTSFNSVLDQIDRCGAAPVRDGSHVDFDSEPLMKAHSDLLQAIDSHIDDCFLVLKALQPPAVISNPHIFTDRWLQQVQHPSIGDFKKAIGAYHKRIGDIVNRLKHAQGRLRSVMFSWGTTRLPGYFLEGVDSKGVVGPDSSVHPKGGALSLSGDLRLHYSGVFLIGESLARAISKALRIRQNFRLKLVVKKSEAGVDVEVFNIARRIGRLPEFVFPDEQPLSIPSVRVFENESTQQIILKARTYPPVATPPRGASVTSHMGGDGYSRSFRLPYLRG